MVGHYRTLDYYLGLGTDGGVHEIDCGLSKCIKAIYYFFHHEKDKGLTNEKMYSRLSLDSLG